MQGDAPIHKELMVYTDKADKGIKDHDLYFTEEVMGLREVERAI